MSRFISHSVAVGAVSAVALIGVAMPAQADDTAPECDPVVLAAAIDAAKTDARTAQKAFTTHTKTSMKALTKGVKAGELREARAAARTSDRLAKKAASAKGKDGKELRAAARAAAAIALAEAKEAAQAQRASGAVLKRQVMADRKILKSEWETAKDALIEVVAYAETCEPVVDEPGIDEPVIDEPVVGDTVVPAP